jgi:hypothetical protein
VTEPTAKTAARNQGEAMSWISTFFTYRGKRLVTCPDNLETAAVNVDALRATVSDVRLSACSRWPEKAGCDQRCLAQIEESPSACLVSTIITSWYEGTSCVLCDRPIGTIAWHDRPPALLSPDGAAFEWSEIAAESLPRVLEACRPLCWNCYLAESFRREFPQLPVERHRQAPSPEPPLNTTNLY